MAIDIGTDAIDRLTYFNISSATFINKENPANASGTITSVEIFAFGADAQNVIVGTFYITNGNTLKCRDSEVIGTVTKGSKQTFPVTIAVEAGDYIGIYATTGFIERDISGYAGVWYVNGQYIDPNDETDYALAAGDAISLYGTGEEVGGYYHGLKVQGVGELALCDVGTHPLRIRKGGTTYGIELVAIDDPNASALRIKTPSGIKAIRKYT